MPPQGDVPLDVLACALPPASPLWQPVQRVGLRVSGLATWTRTTLNAIARCPSSMSEAQAQVQAGRFLAARTLQSYNPQAAPR